MEGKPPTTPARECHEENGLNFMKAEEVKLSDGRFSKTSITHWARYIMQIAPLNIIFQQLTSISIRLSTPQTTLHQRTTTSPKSRYQRLIKRTAIRSPLRPTIVITLLSRSSPTIPGLGSQPAGGLREFLPIFVELRRG